MTAQPLAAAFPAAPDLRLDEIALQLRARRFVLTGLGDRLVTAERGIVGKPEEHREVVILREGPAWYAALFRRRLVEIVNNDGDWATPKYARKPQRESGGLVTLSDVTTWLNEVLA